MKAKKSLGQNFLKSIPALNKIIEAGEISKEDVILEIGPGKGALTEKLLATGCQLIAVEKDKELFNFLQEKFEKEIEKKKLILINDDILNLDVSSNFSSLRPSPSTGWGPREAQNRKTHPDHNKNFITSFYKIIANIPYNITGAILKKFLETENQPERMVLMVQNEVAKRIVANNEPESILSISVKAYGNPKIIMKVPSRYFSPAPKVDSAIILIKNISKKLFNSPLEEYSDLRSEGGGEISTPSRKRTTPQEGKIDEKLFWQVIHAGFAHKRKKLSSNLKNSLIQGLPLDELDKLGDKRAEELTLKDWIELIKMI